MSVYSETSKTLVVGVDVGGMDKQKPGIATYLPTIDLKVDIFYKAQIQTVFY